MLLTYTPLPIVTMNNQKVYPLMREQFLHYQRMLKKRAVEANQCEAWHRMNYLLRREKLLHFVQTVLIPQHNLSEVEAKAAEQILLEWLNERKLERSRDVVYAEGVIQCIDGLEFDPDRRTFTYAIQHRA